MIFTQIPQQEIMRIGLECAESEVTSVITVRLICDLHLFQTNLHLIHKSQSLWYISKNGTKGKHFNTFPFSIIGDH